MARGGVAVRRMVKDQGVQQTGFLGRGKESSEGGDAAAPCWLVVAKEKMKAVVLLGACQVCEVFWTFW